MIINTMKPQSNFNLGVKIIKTLKLKNLFIMKLLFLRMIQQEIFL